MKLNRFTIPLMAGLSVFLLVTACSSTSEPPPPVVENTSIEYEEGVPGGVYVNTVKLTARVTAVDRTNRKLTLLGPDGDEVEVKAGPDAVNFDQIKAGDNVNAAVTEELIISLDDETEVRADGVTTVVALAPKGERPGGVAAEARQITGTVTAIDRQKRTATLEFDNGTVRTFPVRSDIDLTQQKIGQKVVFRVTEMVALSVEKPE